MLKKSILDLSAVVGFADSRQMQRFPLHFSGQPSLAGIPGRFSAACQPAMPTTALDTTARIQRRKPSGQRDKSQPTAPFRASDVQLPANRLSRPEPL
ncbi:MAG: hypothetical protein R3E84_16715 [Pseudomonadales bacterium]